MRMFRCSLFVVCTAGLLSCGTQPDEGKQNGEHTGEHHATCDPEDSDHTDDTEEFEDTDDCPGGQGEALCCQEDESFCGTSASSFGEDCCVEGQVCEQCWSPDDQDYAGMCIGERGMCPEEPEEE